MQQQNPIMSLAPPELALLDDIPDCWVPATEFERRERRATASMAELSAFHARVGPLMPAIAHHLDGFPIAAALPPRELRLFRLGLMYMEVAWAVEVVGEPEEAEQVPRQRWKITPVLQPGLRSKS